MSAMDDLAVIEREFTTEHNDMDMPLAQQTRQQHAVFHSIEQCAAITLFHHHRKVKH